MSNVASPEVNAFFHEPTNTVSYLVWDPATGAAALIDPVLDFDHRSGKASTEATDEILAAARSKDLRIVWCLETHAHADHLSSSPYVKLVTGAKVAIGENIRRVQTLFRAAFNLADISEDGSEFDHLFADGEHFSIGGIDVAVMYTPGHTPACVTYVMGNVAFIGDTLFMPDFGTARADFPGGDARALYNSIQRILSLPEDTRLYLCHDYKASGRDYYAWETTVREERENNIHIGGGVDEEKFVAMRTARDATLDTPLLLMPSIQVNIRAGKFPPAESNGVHYLKIPIELADKERQAAFVPPVQQT